MIVSVLTTVDGGQHAPHSEEVERYSDMGAAKCILATQTMVRPDHYHCKCILYFEYIHHFILLTDSLS